MFHIRLRPWGAAFNVGRAGAAPRPPVHPHRDHHAAGTRSRLRANRHRHRHPSPHAHRHQAGQPRLSLPECLRQTHRSRALPRPHPPHRLIRSTNRVAGPRPWLYPARLQGPTAKLSTRSTTGPTTAKPTSTTSPWPAPKTTATSSPAAGPPENYLRPDDDDAD